MSANHAIDLQRIPGALVEICRRLRGAGHDAYLVGGSVRDLLLGRPVHDWDVTTAAHPDEVEALFARTLPTGIKHGTVTVLQGGLQVEVTTFRGEGAYSDGRHPDSVKFVRRLEEDLGRRDFTINAMAFDPVGGVLADPLLGSADLDRRLIRAVGDPLERFGEDGLRPLRAVRLAAVLEFEVEEQTLAAIPRVIERFRRVSAERVRDELLKLLAAPRPSAGVELMQRSGLLAEVLPELLGGEGLTQNRHHVEDVYRHSLRVCDGVTRDDPLLRLAALLHDVGKPPTARPRPGHFPPATPPTTTTTATTRAAPSTSGYHPGRSSARSPLPSAPPPTAGDHPGRPEENTFHGHEVVGAGLCDAIARRLKLSREQRERLCHLVALHMFELDGWSPPGLRRFLRRAGREHLDALFALRAADLAAREQGAERLAQLAALRQRLDGIVAERAPQRTAELAVNGHDVIARLGIGRGPRVGQILRALLERVTDDPSLNERERLLAIVDELGA